MSMKDLPYKKALVPHVIIGNFHQTSQKQITISRVFKNESFIPFVILDYPVIKTG